MRTKVMSLPAEGTYGTSLLPEGTPTIIKLCLVGQRHVLVTPAKAGVHLAVHWIPACAGMTRIFPNKNENLLQRN